jgi:glyoxylase-like metal-dependent hydrolase (beta-lactamase superfamily II)
MRDVTIEHLSVGVLACTCTIVADVAAGEAIVVDGGDDVDAIVSRLDALGVRATHLVHTHAHIDHIGALRELRERTNAVGCLHAGDIPLYATLREQARWLGVPPPELARLDAELVDGDVLRAGNVRLDVLHTPGHTPGSVSFAVDLGDDAASRTLLLTGDTLFRGAVGRWDIGGTSLADIVNSVQSKLFAYDDDTVVIPGHGPATTIGIEKRENPYVAL